MCDEDIDKANTRDSPTGLCLGSAFFNKDMPVKILSIKIK